MKSLVIIPAFNERESIANVIMDIQKDFPDADIIVVDDESSDGTDQTVKKLGCRILHLSVNLGIGGAVQTGYIYAVENSYDVIIRVDGDGQHDTKYISDLAAVILNQEADVCIGSRYLEYDGFQSTFFRRMGIRIISRLIYVLSGVRIKDATSGFCAVNQRVAELYAKEYQQDYPEPEAILTAVYEHALIREIPVRMKERCSGQSSISLQRSVYYMVKVILSLFFAYLRRAGRGSTK